uniref:DNA polymerase n=1 Tax=Cacopsylla melanoneura TaxID=428564 RepID=A0A8D8Y5W8_9HEMI
MHYFINLFFTVLIVLPQSKSLDNSASGVQRSKSGPKWVTLDPHWVKQLKFVNRMSKRKATSPDNNPNHDFCDFLFDLADYERTVNNNMFKFKAYKNAAAALAALPNRINSGTEALSIKGIGKSIAKKIDEFLSTGKLRKLDSIREDSTGQAIAELTRVSGIGPAKAKELIIQGITTIEDLRNREDLLTHHQIIGLRHLEDFEKRIPRTDVEQYEQLLKTAIAEMDPLYELTICGSYRRGLPSCGDIDVLLTHPAYVSNTSNPDPKQKKTATDLLKIVVERLQQKNLVDETLALGDVKFMGSCKLNGTMRRVDIRLTPFDQYYCAVLYFTGSDVFNQNMRKHALTQNFTLNEYTLRRLGETGLPGEAVTIGSEKDIFDYIDYPHKEPHDRNN